jgi:hypothetical protein
MAWTWPKTELRDRDTERQTEREREREKERNNNNNNNNNTTNDKQRAKETCARVNGRAAHPERERDRQVSMFRKQVG